MSTLQELLTAPQRKISVPSSYFALVPGLTGLGQAWRIATTWWGLPAAVGEVLVWVASLIWAGLVMAYLWQATRHFDVVKAEFLHPVQGGTPALLAISTLLISTATAPHFPLLAWGIALAGITWHLGFSLWHTGRLWKGGRDLTDMLPTLYLPTVAGNFTGAAALGALGCAEWGWLFLGAGLFSWLALESLVLQRLLHSTAVPATQRPLIGIQFAPATVCVMACLSLSPDSADHWLLMLWGYGLFQLLLGLRLGFWLGVQPFIPSYWAYSFGVAAAAGTALKLASLGSSPAQILAVPIFVGANLFIGYLSLRTLHRVCVCRAPHLSGPAIQQD